MVLRELVLPRSALSPFVSKVIVIVMKKCPQPKTRQTQNLRCPTSSAFVLGPERVFSFVPPPKAEPTTSQRQLTENIWQQQNAKHPMNQVLRRLPDLELSQLPALTYQLLLIADANGKTQVRGRGGACTDRELQDETQLTKNTTPLPSLRLLLLLPACANGETQAFAHRERPLQIRSPRYSFPLQHHSCCHSPAPTTHFTKSQPHPPYHSQGAVRAQRSLRRWHCDAGTAMLALRQPSSPRVL